MKLERFSGVRIALVDILFNLMLSFAALFVLILPFINDPDSSDITSKAEVLVIVDWPDRSNDDVDTWVQTQEDEIVFYKNKETRIWHLDRDDVGTSMKDTIETEDGSIVVNPVNREITTMRSIDSGRVVVNLYYFYIPPDNLKQKVDVRVSIIKLNPYREVLNKTITLTRADRERNVATFYVDGKGNIKDVKEDQTVEIASTYMHRAGVQ